MPDRLDVVVTRVFDAPRKLVFAAWTTPEHLIRWFRPTGLTLTIEHMDFRVGGTYRFRYEGLGMDHPFDGVYREIVAPERLVFTANFPDLRGDQIVTTVTFADDGAKTKLEMRQQFPASMAGDPRVIGAPHGWAQTVDNLAAYLKT